MPKHKPKVKASRPEQVAPLPKIDIEKFTKMYASIRDAQLNLARLNTPRPIVIPGPSEQELKSLAIKMGFAPQTIEKGEADRHKIISGVIAERQGGGSRNDGSAWSATHM